MARITLHWLLAVCFASTITFSSAYAEESGDDDNGEWTGYIAGEARLFPGNPLFPDQFEDSDISFSTQPEYYSQWDDGDQSFVFTPFIRVDKNDAERTHGDIRELSWLKASEAWELRVGIRKVFWGVTESQHLVDIINQTDLVEDIDGEDKLGQPMVNLALINEWGTVDLFVLPGFRERTFPGGKGRLRTKVPVDTDHPVYESGAENKHIDFAARWSRFIDIWDIGVSYFYGTGRDPVLTPNAANPTALIPVYNIINQTGLDAQATVGDWLWKLEVISRGGQGDRYTAATGGFEYTLVGIFNTRMDLGVIAEYLYDDRGEQAPTPFQNDLMMGARFTLNDIQSTELLAGFIFDIDHDGHMFNLEASRRLGNAWKLSAEIRAFSNLQPDDPLYSFRNDDYLQLELAWYF
ncbi:MAG: hypothetical protein PVJ39_03705 [Gammaproteobacteria bacterium]|jgi:hypothetical protein